MSALSECSTDLACLNCDGGPYCIDDCGHNDNVCPSCGFDGAMVWADEFERAPDGTLRWHERSLDRDTEPCVRCSATPNYVGDDVTGTWVEDGWCCPDCWPLLSDEEVTA